MQGFLTGGVDGVTYQRGVDYEIVTPDGQVSWVASGGIPMPTPPDLSISYAYLPGSSNVEESYPQQVTLAGASIELDHVCAAYIGTFSTLSGGTGTNLTPVSRTPDHHSYLAPSVRGVYAQVLGVPTSGTTFALDVEADPTQDAVLIQDGIGVPHGSGGWTFGTPATSITIDSTIYVPTSVYEIQYGTRYQWTSPGTAMDIPAIEYVVFPSHFSRKNTTVDMTSQQIILRPDPFGVCVLETPAILDQSLAVLDQSVGGVTTTIPEASWSFQDPTTLSISPAVLVTGAVYTFTYHTELVTTVDAVTEILSYSTCTDNISYPPMTVFQPGDPLLLQQFAKFQVQAVGDIRPQDYRFYGFALYTRTADIVGAGYGTSHYGAVGYGDPPNTCGAPFTDTSPGGDQVLGGTVTMTGALIVTPL
jgi:hypothetical protein